ncbi:Di-heme cytochrome c peroxidase [Alteromonas macleodii str. 'Black Sea 11']|nr:Di-heme cytochrome c peroxidase [Alteromonas macleodii str. 'Black Sea 11']
MAVTSLSLRTEKRAQLAFQVGVVFCFTMVIGACSKSPTPYSWNLPHNIPPPPVPADNPLTEESIILGEKLFFDKGLSASNTISCSSCHDPEHAFAEPKTVSVGANGDALNRNALALVNVAYNASFTWAHNNLESIEKQLMIPLFNEHPVEMGVTGNEKRILKRFEGSEYRALFEAAYGDDTPNLNNIVKALASYVRSLVSFNSAFDNYAYAQDDDALTPQQLEGLNLFFSERTECFHCHGGLNFTQSSKHSFQPFTAQPFHNTGLYNEDGKGSYPESDMGLYSVTHNNDDMGKFRAPTLRNIALTAPYMHDGSIATLDEVIEFYARGGNVAESPNPYRSPFIKSFAISEDEKAALVAFLQSLTDEEFVKTHAKRKK